MSISNPLGPNHTARRLLVFGFSLTFLSGFGQTFFIGLFSGELRDTLGLTDGTFGLVYSFVTLASALSMFWAGGLIDRIPVPLYAVGSVGLLSVGYALLPWVGNLFMLSTALFLLRFAGQGLLAHTAVTSIAGRFGSARGRALSLALLGHPAGEAVLPLLAVLLGTSAGWHSVWFLAASLLLMTSPFLFYLGRNSGKPTETMDIGHETTPAGFNPYVGEKSRRDVIRDRRFYLFLPTLLIPGFVLTGLFIHQTRLMEQKGWALSEFATSFVVFAVTQAVGMLGVGFLIDRMTATRLMPFYLIPLGLACAALFFATDSFTLIPFMAGAGLTAGLSTSIVTAMWAEIYGLMHLGAIRALGSSGMILATALAPPLFGWVLECGVHLDSILFTCTIVIAIAGTLAHLGTLSHFRIHTLVSETFRFSRQESFPKSRE